MIYDIAGIEPPLEDVMKDPIFRHLRRYDGLPTSEWPEIAEPELPDFRLAA